MTSPEDEIPLPSEGVLSDEESAKQLREDSCRQYVERIRQLDALLEGLASHLLIARRDLDAANLDVALHFKLRLELVTALSLDSLPPRGDNSRIFEAIEKLQEAANTYVEHPETGIATGARIAMKTTDELAHELLLTDCVSMCHADIKQWLDAAFCAGLDKAVQLLRKEINTP